ncbi:hypothetical protein BO94DRAFT_80326 [Aspergillus sclerotioniger CBS 115572]|uniref:Uncharacterized protein n=1 Tax=Aspergillus sclerotioniger CBS 115572 TaxID=1450535 RepID=A0A317WIS4_9EURO|nr:hypothetical protein BO94DRAFT_80326 [Aspergillus sclerotioniger CBS 115572]PWY86364.1 hypothetical protein BO94DRAFT_80326 [Aspergillus sclerotioniger CBS 115572]
MNAGRAWRGDRSGKEDGRKAEQPTLVLKKPGCDRQMGRYRIRPSGTRYHPYIPIRNPKRPDGKVPAQPQSGQGWLALETKIREKDQDHAIQSFGDPQRLCMCVSHAVYLLEATKKWPHRARPGECPIVRRHYHLAPQRARGPEGYYEYGAVPDDDTAPGNRGRYRRSMIRYLTTTRNRIIPEPESSKLMTSITPLLKHPGGRQ